jgi:hypothetical protein
MLKVGSFVYINSDMKNKNITIKEKEVGIITVANKDIVNVDFVSKNINIKLSSKDVTEFNPKETGDGFECKVCNICHMLLNTEEFSKNQNGKNNRVIRRPSCKNCRIPIDGKSIGSADKKTYQANKPHLIKFTCPVCKKTTIAGLTSKIVLDHDHNTGEVRGWICDSCNTGLGRFKDNIILLDNAKKYLKDK